MTTTATPYFVVDAAGREDHDAPPYQAFLDWLKAEGIDPNVCSRCEVYEAQAGKSPYAITTMYKVDDKGHKVLDEAREWFLTYTKRVDLSSLPPSREV